MSDSVPNNNKSRSNEVEALAKAKHAAADARRWIDALIQALRADSARLKDPHAVHIIADLKVRLHAAEAVIAHAAQISTQDVASTEVFMTIAAGRVLALEIVVLVAEKLFELTGSRDGFDALDPDDALQEPVRWTFHAIGDVVVNGARTLHHPQA